MNAAVHSHRFCVAPMMDGTDRHCRYFHRLLTKRARLYSEMVTAEAVRHGDRDRLLAFDPAEHPVALQLGGSDPVALADAARIGEDYGYDEINLNVGCPSDRVQSGAFGACLMKSPALVADCIASMRAKVRATVTVKCRIGVDDQDPEQSLFAFVEAVAAAGARIFIVHARKAWLKGLSPRENREVPPLDYPLVRRLAVARPDLDIVLNGGVTSIAQAEDLVPHFAGVMMGRKPYAEPYVLAEVDRRLFGDDAPPPSRDAVAASMHDYLRRMEARGVRPHHVTRHMLGLFHGLPGARGFRRALSERGAATDAGALGRALEATQRTAVMA